MRWAMLRFLVSWSLGLLGSQFAGAQTHPLAWMCFSLVVVISLALLISLIVVFIMLISLLSCLQERTTGASLVARMRGDARARARREQRAWRARREQRARVQGGRVGSAGEAEARQKPTGIPGGALFGRCTKFCAPRLESLN